jgi:radical SAM superfamily enzyme YgiQ (UPF0313 family)
MISVKKSVALVNVINLDMEEKLRIPVGLIYLGSALKKHGYKVTLYQPIQRREEIQRVEDEIIRENPLFVGFSVFMGPGSVESLNMCERLKKASGIKIVWGGKFPTSISEQAIKEESIDVVCLGEGEETVVELANAFEANASLEGVKGICYKAGNEIVHTEPRELIQDLDTLDYDLGMIQDWSRYFTTFNGRPALLDVIESQRGCPFCCRFCFQNREFDKKTGKKIVRFHSIGWVLEKAKYLKKITGVEYVSFCDDEFWIKSDRAFEVIEKLHEVGLKFYKLRMRFSSLRDEEMIARLIKNEVCHLNFGLESGVDRILKLMDKRQTTQQILTKTRLLAKYPQIMPGAPIIIGNPTETKEEVLESIRFALKLCSENPNFVFGVNLYKPLPRTDFFDMAVNLGFVPPQDVRGWENVEHKLVYKLARGWLPWFNKREELNYRRVFDYLAIFNGLRKSHAVNPRNRRFGILNPLNALKKIFEITARERLYHWFFLFPVEVWMLKIYRSLRAVSK